MQRRPPIIFIEQYFFPEEWGGAQIPRDIAADLAKEGHPVSVVCGRDQYVSPSPKSSVSNADPRHNGIVIRHVPKAPAFMRRSKGLLGQLWFSIFAVVFVVFQRRRPMLIVQTNPPLIVVAAAAAALLLRRPLILIAQDIYPEVMIAHGMIKRGSATAKLLVAIFRWAYKRAAYVVSLGPTMTARLKEKGVAADRVCEICNWATGDLGVVRGPSNSMNDEWGLTGKFVLLYSGNLGVAHDVETMLRAMAAARRSLPALRMVIIGSGSRIAQARSLVQALEIDDLVQFKPPVPGHLLPLSLGVADMGVVSLLPGFDGLVVPSKLLGLMARGIPTVYVGPRNSDVAELVSKSGGGIIIENGNSAKLAARLVEFASNRADLERMGKSALSYYASHLSRDIGLANYRSVVARVADVECVT